MTWHTKDNLPFITPGLEADLYAFIKDRIIVDPQTYFHAVGGIEQSYSSGSIVLSTLRD
jgi:hypothetical protein